MLPQAQQTITYSRSLSDTSATMTPLHLPFSLLSTHPLPFCSDSAYMKKGVKDFLHHRSRESCLSQNGKRNHIQGKNTEVVAPTCFMYFFCLLTCLLGGCERHWNIQNVLLFPKYNNSVSHSELNILKCLSF